MIVKENEAQETEEKEAQVAEFEKRLEDIEVLVFE